MITSDKNTYTLTTEFSGTENKIIVVMMRNNVPMVFERMNDHELKTYAAISSYQYNKIIEEMTRRKLI